MYSHLCSLGTLATLLATCLAQDLNFDGSQVWRVFPTNNDQVQVLDSLRDTLDFWTDMPGGATDIRTDGSNNASLIKVLNQHQIKYDLHIPDLGPLVAQEKRVGTITTRNSAGMNWKNYQSTATIHNWLEVISAKHEDISKVITIGKSTENRPLKLIKIGVRTPNARKKAYWIDGGFHAREWISPAIVTWYINEMLTNKQKYMELFRNIDFYILPILNVDGYEFSRTKNRFWRKTRSRTNNPRCIGVDPNRNFDFHWTGPGNSINPCSEVYRGPKPFSEPETKAMRDFIAKMNASNADWIMYNSFHSYAQVILSPWGWTNQLPPDHNELKKLGQSAAAAVKKPYSTNYRAGAISELLSLGSGASDDWAYGSKFFKRSYTYEVRDTGRHGFVLPPVQIEPTAKETWAGVLVMAEYVRKM